MDLSLVFYLSLQNRCNTGLVFTNELHLSFFAAVLAHEYFPSFTAKISTFTPLIGVILVTLLCASPVSAKTPLPNPSFV